ncbi:MAG: hypothetical protein ACLTYW_01560 [Collinsella sp.]
MITTANEPGALYRVLERFYALNINLIKLESRPIPGMTLSLCSTLTWTAPLAARPSTTCSIPSTTCARASPTLAATRRCSRCRYRHNPPYGVLGRVLGHSYTPTIYKELAGSSTCV